MRNKPWSFKCEMISMFCPPQILAVLISRHELLFYFVSVSSCLVPVRVSPTADPSLQPGPEASTPTLLLRRLPLSHLLLPRCPPQACGALLHPPFLLYRSSSSLWLSRLPRLPSRSPRGCCTRPLRPWRLPFTAPRPISSRSWTGAHPRAPGPSRTAASCLLPRRLLLCPTQEHGALRPVTQARPLCRPSPRQEPWPRRCRPTACTISAARGTIRPICRPSATPAASCWRRLEKVGRANSHCLV